MVVDVDLEKTAAVADCYLPETLPVDLRLTPQTGTTATDPSLSSCMPDLTCKCTETISTEDQDSSLAPGPDESSFSGDIPFSNSLDADDINEPPHVNDALEENKFTILSHEIIFPYQAYESQREMMEKILRGVQAEENCLLESPTGTGKTAALLCGLLAWQSKFEKDEDERLRQLEEEKRQKEEENALPSTSKKFKGDEFPVKTSGPQVSTQPTNSPRKTTPKIYYATRTHSQIDGVVKQLGQTAYKNVPMSILASRKRTCINPVATKSKSFESTCQKFRNVYDGKHSDGEYTEGYDVEGQNSQEDQTEESERTCKFYHGSLKKTTFKKAEEETWDIEDLKIHGNKCSSCPYQELSPLHEKAKIVFCTYNHILHKYIRKALKIKLTGNIVVFDEAHNIEEVCSSIASFSGNSISVEKIQDIRIKFDEADLKQRPLGEKKQALLGLNNAFTRLQEWLRKQLELEAPGFEIVSSSRYEGKKLRRKLSEKLIEELKAIKFCPDQIKQLWADYFVLEDRHYTIKPAKTDPPFRVDSEKMRDVCNFLYVFSYLFKKDPGSEKFTYFKDFAKFLIKTRKPVPKRRAAAFRMAKKRGPKFVDADIQLSLHCLNPAIVFQQMHSARSIIVASGTLAPKDSFSTELATEFRHQLSAKHVMGPDRIFTSIINSNSETNIRLKFDSKTLDSEDTYENHQGQIFNIVLRISLTVPFDILVFFPSKSFITKLKSEWNQNGNLRRLMSAKDLYFEHENENAANADAFKQMMASYKKKIQDPKGAILFAYFRGSISEGVDFKDNEARAVITIGIPMLPCKDDKILAKRAYNTEKAKLGKSCLTGDQWYNASAFRAINQAFGRCVRHVKDWGAIFIVDSRFTNNYVYKLQLSKWVRDSLRAPGRITNGSLDEVLPLVEHFVETLVED